MKMRTRLIRRWLIGLLVAAAIALTFNLWQAGDEWVWVLLMYIISTPLAIGALIYWWLDQAQARWNTIKIELGDDYVARPFGGTTLRVDKNEVTSIDEIKGELYVRTRDNFLTLIIPKELDASDYQKIKKALLSWTPDHE